jgi:hypothetical protein
MYLRGNLLGPSTSRHEDYPLAAAVGFVVAAYLGFFVVLYWLMQPTVTANPGLAAYRPPPKAVVRYADSPWVPPPPSEALLPIRAAAEPAPEIAKSSVAAEPKKETKKQEARTSPRRARPVREQQPNPFWGYASSRSSGSRPWF